MLDGDFRIKIMNTKFKEFVFLLYFISREYYISHAYILCQINLAIVFVCLRSIVAGIYCHFMASRYKCRSPKKNFQVKESRMINFNVCDVSFYAHLA